jgi:DNA-binding GntR family transcriptional regulator
VNRYTEIADELIGRIRSGALRVGGRLPGELQLMEDFAASRHTIREALRGLEELGLIERRRGLGTRVLARRPQRAYVHRVASPEELLRYPVASRLAVTRSGKVTVSASLAALLGCRPGARWVHVDTVRRMGAGRPPICRTELYLLPKYAAVVPQIGRGRKAVYRLLEQRYGLNVAEVDVDVTARPMPADAADALGVGVGSPSMRVVRRYRDDAGEVFQVSVSDHPGDRYGFSQRLRRDWATGDAGWMSA